MSFFELILLSLALGADAFSVALALGHRIKGFRPVFRLSWHFGLFQFLMPLVGWALGEVAAGIAGGFAPWAAFVLLAIIGGRMVWQFFRAGDEQERKYQALDPTRGWSLLVLSLATSMDALGVGIGLGLVASSLLVPCLVIGVTAAAMTAGGVLLGRLIGMVARRWAELIGGLILIGIGIQLVVS